MRHNVWQAGLPLAVMTVAACPAAIPPVPIARPGGTAVVRSASSPTPLPPAGSAPIAVASPAGPTAAPGTPAVPLATLRAPAAAHTVLSGVVTIDASYMVGAGAGTLAADGASVVSNDGAGLIGAGGGTLIAPDGASVVSNDGAGLIARDGTSLIGSDAANIVAGGGLNAGGGRFRLAAAEAASVGKRLPAAGMRVRAIDLRDGKPFSLGEDADGKPIYAVLSGPRGDYEIYMAKGLPLNFRLVAEVPGSDDPRLSLAVLGGPGHGEIDDAGELAYKFVRASCIGRLADILGEFKGDAALAVAEDPVLAEVVRPLLDRLMASAAVYRARHPNMTEADRYALAARIASHVLASTDLRSPTLFVDPQLAAYPEETTDQALAALTEVVGQSLERSRQVIQDLKDGGGDPKAWFRGITVKPERRGAIDPSTFELRKPSDVQDYFARAYMATTRFDRIKRTELIYELMAALNAFVAHERPGRFEGAIAAITRQIFASTLDPTRDPVTGLTVEERLNAMLTEP